MDGGAARFTQAGVRAQSASAAQTASRSETQKDVECSVASIPYVRPRRGARPRPPQGQARSGDKELLTARVPEREDAKAKTTPGIAYVLPPGWKLNTRPGSARPAIARPVWKVLSPLSPEPEQPSPLRGPYCVSWEHRIQKETLGTLAGSAACEARHGPLTCRPLAWTLRAHSRHHGDGKRCPALTDESGRDSGCFSLNACVNQLANP